MAQQKRYTVAKSFTDKNGRTWSQGQEWTGDQAEAVEQTQQGNLKEEAPQK